MVKRHAISYGTTLYVREHASHMHRWTELHSWDYVGIRQAHRVAPEMVYCDRFSYVRGIEWFKSESRKIHTSGYTLIRETWDIPLYIYCYIYNSARFTHIYIRYKIHLSRGSYKITKVPLSRCCYSVLINKTGCNDFSTEIMRNRAEARDDKSKS